VWKLPFLINYANVSTQPMTTMKMDQLNVCVFKMNSRKFQMTCQLLYMNCKIIKGLIIKNILLINIFVLRIIGKASIASLTKDSFTNYKKSIRDM